LENRNRNDTIDGMKNNPLPRLDTAPEVRDALRPFCRLKAGEIWEDGQTGHRVGCLDAGAADWVLASKEMAANRHYSTGQHRGNTGEGQLHLKDDNVHEIAE
jgi:hypothetical protein